VKPELFVGYVDVAKPNIRQKHAEFCPFFTNGRKMHGRMQDLNRFWVFRTKVEAASTK
jgi:sRNA-binding regulator protein Hfq